MTHFSWKGDVQATGVFRVLAQVVNRYCFAYACKRVKNSKVMATSNKALQVLEAVDRLQEQISAKDARIGREKQRAELRESQLWGIQSSLACANSILLDARSESLENEKERIKFESQKQHGWSSGELDAAIGDASDTAHLAQRAWSAKVAINIFVQ